MSYVVCPHGGGRGTLWERLVGLPEPVFASFLARDYLHLPPLRRGRRAQASHGDDARAGRSPWHGGLGEVLPGTLGLRVVQFLPIRPHRRTRLLRPGSTVSAVADQRGGLAQSSWARRLARVAGHHPQPPGSRFAYAPWSLHLTKLTNPAEVELRVLTLLPTRRATAPRPFGKPALRSACGPSVGERNAAAGLGKEGS